jgi:iron-sulfur cluster repair protein YtfE (RIC family)
VKRHPELRPLSEHHHHVLVLALEIRRAAESSAPDRYQRLRTLAESLLRFWDESGRIHFMEEEQVLLPKYARHFRLDEDPEIMRMLADHAAICAKMEDVKECLAGSLAPEPLTELGRMLHDHVRLEEDRIFPKIEKALNEIELNSVGSRLTRLHGEK